MRGRTRSCTIGVNRAPYWESTVSRFGPAVKPWTKTETSFQKRLRFCRRNTMRSTLSVLPSQRRRTKSIFRLSLASNHRREQSRRARTRILPNGIEKTVPVERLVRPLSLSGRDSERTRSPFCTLFVGCRSTRHDTSEARTLTGVRSNNSADLQTPPSQYFEPLSITDSRPTPVLDCGDCPISSVTN